ncbi:MAG: NUDIX domain-containing protein [Candidatus Woesearchaeota archaeon]
MPQEFSAGVIVFLKEGNAIKYLLLRYTKGYWGFSKGNIEKGESSREAAYRELREETGISDAKPFEGFKERIEFFYRSGKEIVHKEVIFYLAEANEQYKDKIKLTEHTDYCWVSFEEALSKLQFKNDKELLKKANNFLLAYYS